MPEHRRSGKGVSCCSKWSVCSKIWGWVCLRCGLESLAGCSSFNFWAGRSKEACWELLRIILCLSFYPVFVWAAIPYPSCWLLLSHLSLTVLVSSSLVLKHKVFMRIWASWCDVGFPDFLCSHMGNSLAIQKEKFRLWPPGVGLFGKNINISGMMITC